MRMSSQSYGLYHNVWPRANSGHFLLFTKNLYALERPVMDSIHHAKFHPCILSGFEIRQSKLNNNNNKNLRTDLAIFTILGVHAFFDHTNWPNLSKVGSDS